MTRELSLKREGHIAWLTLNRPEKRNAISFSMWRTFPILMQEAAKDPAVRVLILRGEGNAFSSGADISEFEEFRLSPATSSEYDLVSGRAENALATFPKPSIAMVRGACIGGGCELALACDLRITDESGLFGITPSRLGLVYSLVATKRLVDTVGPSTAKLILFSGELLSASSSYDVGLVDEVVEASTLARRVEDLAATIASRAPLSVRSAKRTIELALRGQNDESQESLEMAARAYSTSDYQEGVRAFLEKRPPKFSDL